MKGGVNIGGTAVLVGLAVLGAAVVVLWNRKAIANAANAVNPASPDNLVNRGVSAVGGAVTGDASWTLGGQLAEWFSPSVRAANEAFRRPRDGYASVLSPWEGVDEIERLIGRYGRSDQSAADMNQLPLPYGVGA